MTTLSERQWERRLQGEAVWLVECYAAWCPACRAFVPTWQVRTASRVVAHMLHRTLYFSTLHGASHGALHDASHGAVGSTRTLLGTWLPHAGVAGDGGSDAR